MMNRKGDIGQTITTLVVFFGVFFLMAIFVIASSNIGALLNKGKESYGIEDNEFLFQKVEVGGMERLVFEGMVMLLQEKITHNDFADSLNGLVSEENNCVIVLYGEDKIQFSDNAVYYNGEILINSIGLEESLEYYGDYLNEFSLKDDSVRFSGYYYKGRCRHLDE